jgi:hypothetical protein
MRKSLFFAVITFVTFTRWAHARDAGVIGAASNVVPAVMTVQMPEPSSQELLAIDLVSVAALIMVFRRRWASRTGDRS